MIEIQTDIPLPPRKPAGRHTIYPFAQMEIGHSFFTTVKASSFARSVSVAKKKTGFQFALRTLTENGVKGVRVWRIA